MSYSDSLLKPSVPCVYEGITFVLKDICRGTKFIRAIKLDIKKNIHNKKDLTKIIYYHKLVIMKYD